MPPPFAVLSGVAILCGGVGGYRTPVLRPQSDEFLMLASYPLAGPGLCSRHWNRVPNFAPFRCQPLPGASLATRHGFVQSLLDADRFVGVRGCVSGLDHLGDGNVSEIAVGNFSFGTLVRAARVPSAHMLLVVPSDQSSPFDPTVRTWVPIDVGGMRRALRRAS